MRQIDVETIFAAVQKCYQTIREAVCECGKAGVYKMKQQALCGSKDGAVDVMKCVCRECGHERTFIFRQKHLDGIVGEKT